MPTIYAVNGKEPVAAWIPSLDTAGNGTTTLTDLVASNNGTLTNMDAATDWVADTAAGGVRALDFDGVDDYVRVPHSASYNVAIGTWSIWAYCRTFPTHTMLFSKAGSWNNWGFLILSGGTWRPTTGSYTDVPGHSAGTWIHFATSNSGSRHVGYVNGVEVFNNATSAAVTSSLDLWIGREQNTGGRWSLNGRLDDFRIFSDVLNSTDIAYLYNSGNGRGIIPALGNPTANLQHNLQSMRLGL